MDGDAIGYINSGSDGENTFRENTASAARYRIRPRVLQGISEVDTTSSILGYSIPFPICVAPTACHRLTNHQAELATAKGVTSAGVVMTLSSVASVRSKEVMSSFPNGLFFMQANVVKDKKLHELMLREAYSQGHKAIVLSVDCAVLSKRRQEASPTLIQRFCMIDTLPINYLQNEEGIQRAWDRGPSAFRDYFMDQTYESTPVDLSIIRWIKRCSKLPVITKGILSGKAARQAVENGADAVWISNHGGRQLDFTPTTLDVLPEVVEALKGTNTEVYIDSGFRSGSDVFKALALGAKCVFVGRPILWGLAVRGPDGVRDILEIMRDELKLCMLLSGCPDIKSITRNHVIKERNYLSAKL